MNTPTALEPTEQAKQFLEKSLDDTATSWLQKWKNRNQRKRWISILNKEINPKDFVNKFKALEANTFGDYLTMRGNGSFSVSPKWITRSTDLACFQYAILCQRIDVMKYLQTPEGKHHSMNNAQRSIDIMKGLAIRTPIKKIKR